MDSINQIIFFLGAGASVPAGLRTVVQLTHYFKEYWLKEKCQNPSYIELVKKTIESVKEFRNRDYNKKIRKSI
jgi:NAD-dependent SIR2 family protein deacetylase